MTADHLRHLALNAALAALVVVTLVVAAAKWNQAHIECPTDRTAECATGD